MPDPAIAKVEDAIAGVLRAWPALSGFTVLTGQSSDVALEEGTNDTIVIASVAYKFDVADENWMTLHTAQIDVESVSQVRAVGTINRANQAALAHVVGAIGADRTIGGIVQDIQEVDVAPAGAMGRDVGSASIQFLVQFFTPRNDHFTIVGPGGNTF
ncbi:hypothetical protein [Novosphingobium sp.]|uniref:hypothetical protein n=1 Tax=Novosphingobium sp. TaxID=1874826 RepID=UPI002FDE860B